MDFQKFWLKITKLEALGKNVLIPNLYFTPMNPHKMDQKRKKKMNGLQGRQELYILSLQLFCKSVTLLI